MTLVQRVPLDGLAAKRSVNRRAMIALLLLVPAASLGTASAMFWWPELALGKVIFVGSKLWLVLLPLVWLRVVDREPMSGSPPRHGGFLAGAVIGLVIALIVFVTYVAARAAGAIDGAMIAERAARTGLNRPALYVGGAVYWITVNSLMEEYVWRWFVFRKCELLVGGKAAVALAALAFTAHHGVALAAQFNWAITLLGSMGVFLGGAAWSWLYRRYRSIWPAYVSHGIVDVAVFGIGYALIFRPG